MILILFDMGEGDVATHSRPGVEVFTVGVRTLVEHGNVRRRGDTGDVKKGRRREVRGRVGARPLNGRRSNGLWARGVKARARRNTQAAWSGPSRRDAIRARQ